MFTLKAPLFTTVLILLNGLYLSAGDLTPPPGAPTSTMKTLDQIEPRIPLQPQIGEDIVITEPGNYYMTEAVDQNAELRIESSNVVLDLGGFPHEFSNDIIIDASGASTSVRIQNGSLLGSVGISCAGDAIVMLNRVAFEGGKVKVDRQPLELSECSFVSTSDSEPNAVSIQNSSVVAKNCLFQGYNEAVALSGHGAVHSAQFEGCRFIGNMIGVFVYWEGSIYLNHCFFEGAFELDEQSYCAVQNGVGKVEVVNSRFRNFDRVFILTHDQTKLAVSDSTVEQSDFVLYLEHGNELEGVVFSNTSLEGSRNGAGKMSLFDSSGNDVYATFIDCQFSYFDRISYTYSTNCHLAFDGCRFSEFSSFEWPENTQIIESTLLPSASTNQFVLNHGSALLNSTIRSALFIDAFTMPILLEEGVSVIGCRLENLSRGLHTLSDDVMISDTSILFDSGPGRGEVAISNASPSGTRSALTLTGVTISGYTDALNDGDFQVHDAVIKDCLYAFNNLGNLQLSESSVYVEFLGEVQEVAVITDSNLRVSNDGLWVGRINMRNSSLTNQDWGSGRGLEVDGYSESGGSIRESTISGFNIGVYASAPVTITESSFSECYSAIDMQSSGGVFTKNTISDCEMGIDVNADAIITENVISVGQTGIYGSGLIVKNVVMVEQTPAYDLGTGTHGRELTGAAINPEAEGVAEPWANVWESE